MGPDKKIVLITGANKGVGYETAKNLVLSSSVYHVLIGSRDNANGHEAVASLQALDNVQGTVEAIQIDVTDDDSILAAAKTVGEKHGRLDCLVNNAGVSNKSTNPGTQLRENLAVNTVGPVVVTDAFVGLLKKSSDPRLIFVTTSLASLLHATDPSSMYYQTKASYPYDYYRASKAALNMIMVEYNKREGQDIKIWGGDPGWLATDLANKEVMEKLGAPHPSVGGNEIARCIKGERDEDVGKVVGKYGVQKCRSVTPWVEACTSKRSSNVRKPSSAPSMRDSDPSSHVSPPAQAPSTVVPAPFSRFDFFESTHSLDLYLEAPVPSSHESQGNNIEHMTIASKERAPEDPPDGGLQAWLVVAGCWCAFICSFGWINCVGVFQDYYEGHQLRAYSSSTVAWISSTESCMMFLGGIFFGHLFDSYGPRVLLLAGSLAHVLGLMLVSCSTAYYQIILCQGVLSALGASAIFYACTGAVGTHFRHRRATAFGIVSSGASLGGVIFPVMAARLMPALGFPNTMRIMAVLLAALLILANLAVRSRLTHTRKPFRPTAFARPLYTEPVFCALVAAMFVFSVGTFVPFTFLVVQARSPSRGLRGSSAGAGAAMSPGLAPYLITILNAASIPGRVLPGVIADHCLGRFNTMLITSTLSAVLVLCLWLPVGANVTADIVFTAAYGFSSGAYVSLGPSLVAQISDVKEIGLRTGTVFLFVGVAVLAGSPIGGLLVGEDKGGFGGLQGFCGGAMVLGSVGFGLARVLLGGWGCVVV